MGTFSRSASLFRSSWEVLRQDKELMLLPILSTVAAVVLMAPFLAGVFVTSNAAKVIEATGPSAPQFTMQPLGWVLLFLGYLVASYVVIFFQAALVLAANERLTGGSPTLSSALRMAAANAGHILPWALVCATVSIVIKAIQQKTGVVGQILGAVAGVAWALVTLLVVPIMVIEHVGMKEAVTRSGQAFKRTWGENLTVNGGLGLVSVIAVFAGFGVAFAIGLVSPVAALVVFVAWMVLVSSFTGALGGIFRTALYRYAVKGEESPGFTEEQLAGAFRTRSKQHAAAH